MINNEYYDDNDDQIHGIWWDFDEEDPEEPQAKGSFTAEHWTGKNQRYEWNIVNRMDIVEMDRILQEHRENFGNIRISKVNAAYGSLIRVLNSRPSNLITMKLENYIIDKIKEANFKGVTYGGKGKGKSIEERQRAQKKKIRQSDNEGNRAFVEMMFPEKIEAKRVSDKKKTIKKRKSKQQQRKKQATRRKMKKMKLRGTEPFTQFESIIYQYEDGYCTLGLMQHLYDNDYCSVKPDRLNRKSEWKDVALDVFLRRCTTAGVRYECYDVEGDMFESSLREDGKYARFLVTNGHINLLRIKPKIKSVDVVSDETFNEYIGGDKCKGIYSDHYVINNGEKKKKEIPDPYSNIDKKFNLKKQYSLYDTIFHNKCGIRPANYTKEITDYECMISQDFNNCYRGIIESNLPLPLCDLDNHPEEYKGQEINPMCFYHVSVKEIIPGVFKDNIVWCAGWKLQLFKDNIESIDQMYVCKKISRTRTKSNFSNGDMRKYSGFIESVYTLNDRYIDSDNIEELEYMIEKHKFNSVNLMNNKIHIHSSSYKQTSGVISKLMIYEYSGYLCHLLYKRMKNIYPDMELQCIKTDCVKMVGNSSGSSNFEQLRLKIDLFDNIFTTKYERAKYNFCRKMPEFPWKFEMKEMNELDDWHDIVDERLSCIIRGIPGSGKTYLTVNSIIPYMKEKGVKCSFFTTTKRLGVELGIGLAHSALKKSYCLSKMVKEYRGSYIVIDEGGLLPYHYYHIIQELMDSGVHIILVGDHRQLSMCSAVSQIDLPSVKQMMENVYTVEYDPKVSRYDTDLKEVVDHIAEYIDMGYDHVPIELIDYLESQFPDMEEITYDTVVLGHRNDVVSQYQDGRTVHSSQGFTIRDVDIYIVDWKNSYCTPRLIYTAITRSNKKSNIYLCGGILPP